MGIILAIFTSQFFNVDQLSIWKRFENIKNYVQDSFWDIILINLFVVFFPLQLFKQVARLFSISLLVELFDGGKQAIWGFKNSSYFL